MEQVKVLSTWASAYGMRVLIGLEEKGVKYEYQEEDLPFNKSDLLLQMNPVHKKVPVLIHNGQPICESLIILEYIDEAWDSKQFLPSKPYDRALARFWADFADKKVYGSAACILWSKDEAQEEAKHDMLESFQFLEGALKEVSAGGSVPFFSGKDFGFLDIALIPIASLFHAFETLGNFKISFENEYPLLDAWVKRCMERDSVKKALPSPDRGGSAFARTIIFRNVYMKNVSNPIIIDQNYCDSDKPCPKQESAVKISNISYQNIKGTTPSKEAVKFDCSEAVPCKGISMQNIHLDLNSGGTPSSYCSNVEGSTAGSIVPSACF